MIQIHFERLRRLGLSPALAQHAVACADQHGPSPTDLQLMRLTEVHRETVRLHDGQSEHSARVQPRLLRQLAEPIADEAFATAPAAATLAVGDWVWASATGEAWVHARVPPATHIQRRDADGRRHAVVSNVDTALLVMGLDDDFNPRRLERYLTLVQASGVMPVIVLTKADVLAPTPGALEARVASLLCRMPAHIDVLAVDGTDSTTARRLSPYLGLGQTLVLLGSSGAGKSTLTNTLLGAPVQDTGAVRLHDSRGKHTTTSRSLHALPGGACVIDTPGLRALRPDVDAATLAATFDDIESLAAHCRFRDCHHHDEPGCAVREGVHSDRLLNYQKLLRESRRDTLSAIERQQQVASWKARGKATRAWMKLKRGEE